MKYFEIPTIKAAIEWLQEEKSVKAHWRLWNEEDRFGFYPFCYSRNG